MLKKFKKGRDGYNVFTLLTGTTISQVIPILITPILSRMFLPESFGILGTVVSIVGIMSVVCSLKYEMAIVLPSTEEKRADLLNLSFVLLMIFSFLTFIVVMVFTKSLSEVIFNDLSLYKHLYFIPFFVLFSGLTEIFKQWLTAEKKFSDISTINIQSSLFTNGFKVILGLFFSHPVILVTGQTIGPIAGIAYFFYKYKLTIKNFYENFSFKRINAIAKEYKNFPLFSAPQNLLNSISHNIPVLMLTALFGLEITGLYVMARRIIFLPFTVISKSVYPVLYKKMADTFNKGQKISRQIILSTAGLFFIILIPSIVILFWGNEIFLFFLGEKWEYAGTISKILLPLIITSFIKPPAYIASNVLGKQKQMLVFEILLSIITPLSILSGYIFFKSPYISLLVFSIAFSLLNIVIIVHYIFQAKVSDLKLHANKIT